VTIEERFLSKVNKNSGRFCKVKGTECWEWLAAKDIAGYGVFGSKVSQRAHRFSCWFYNTTREEEKLELLVCHTCDWTSCVNPDHLFLGTDYDNMRDKVKKGRAKGQASGSEHSLSKITDGDVELMFEWNQLGKSNLEIAEKFNLDPSNVSLILRGKRWGHVETPYRYQVKDSRRFTDQEIIEIFKSYRELKSYKKVAKRFDTVQSVIYNIIKRIKYPHVSVPEVLLVG